MLVALVLTAFGATKAQAGGPKCVHQNTHGVCTVWAGGGGAGGGSGGRPSAGAETTATCTLNTLGVEQKIPCTWRGMPFSKALQCYVSVAKPQPPKTNAIWNGHADGAIYECRLPGSFTGIKFHLVWLATPPAGPDPAALAAEAMKSLRIPAPVPGRYPAGRLQDGTPFTVVGAYTWYWTARSTYRPLSASVSAGGVTVRVRVAPAALTFTPGDGSGRASCAGPGLAWNSSDGVWAPSPGGCDFRYPHSSIHQSGHVVTATYGIRWAIMWSASTGQSGVLPDLTTTARSTFAVAEAESVVIQ